MLSLSVRVAPSVDAGGFAVARPASDIAVSLPLLKSYSNPPTPAAFILFAFDKGGGSFLSPPVSLAIRAVKSAVIANLEAASPVQSRFRYFSGLGQPPFANAASETHCRLRPSIPPFRRISRAVDVAKSNLLANEFLSP